MKNGKLKPIRSSGSVKIMVEELYGVGNLSNLEASSLY